MNHIVKILSATILSCIMASAWADISSGLVAHYSLDGDANDQVGQYHGSVHNAIEVEDRFENPNGAFYFDGQSYISVEDIEAFEETSSISVTFWVSPDAYDDYLNVFGIGDIDTNSEDSTFRAEIQENGFYGFFGGTSKKIRVTGQTMVPVDEWSFIALTHDNSTEQSRLYVNGNLYNVLEDSRIKFSSPTQLTIGVGFRVDDEHFFQGKIDDVRLYNRALSKADVQELYKKCSVEGTCPIEPASHEAQIDYYRDENSDEIWVDPPAWRSRWRIKGLLPDNISEYGLRSLYLARYACGDTEIRTWMPFNLIEAAYYCTNKEDRQTVSDHLQGMVYQLQEELGNNKNSENEDSDDEGSDDGTDSDDNQKSDDGDDSDDNQKSDDGDDSDDNQKSDDGEEKTGIFTSEDFFTQLNNK
ncbi:conserved hypothetical protein, secreted [Beggiatoa sp. PS]|nr:conserved hypothetical protein, secreted [Beggiatoa sp. PS]